jgi:Spy/CpxP family protein refolding chaperone
MEITMRRMIGSMAFGLALTLGAVVASAQSTEPPRQRGGQAGAERRQPPDAFLLKGITLSAEQKTRLETLRASQRAKMEGSRDQFRTAMTEARAARERGDTASANAKMRDVRAQMNQHRDQQASAVRALLTSDQQRVFDTNLAEMKARGDQRNGEHRGEGTRGGDRQSRSS